MHPDAVEVYREIQRLLAAIRRQIGQTRDPRRRARLVAFESQVRVVQLRYSEDMDRAAVLGGRLATSAMRRRFDRTKTPRAARGGSPLRRALTARRAILPLPTGGVGIADVERLEALRNPFAPSYGSYWRAQEFGTGSSDPDTGITVPSQIGRRIHGFFTDRSGIGNAQRPVAGGGTHARFIASSSPFALQGPKGGQGGPGLIRREIEGRHFIRDGAHDAYPEWLRAIRTADRHAIRSLQGLRGLPAAQITRAPPRVRRRP
jgi:hypothetical protein